MLGKQFKILNKKLNCILQSQADFVSSVEIVVMLKAQEVRLCNTFSGLIQVSESRILEKVDDAMMKLVKLSEALHPQIAQMSIHQSKSLTEFALLLNELKDLISNPGSSPLITPKLLSQNFFCLNQFSKNNWHHYLE
ncbi:unnamed protein product [Lactuca saligna]|uniref:Uncharacterized protein n=1 Tax=Lactuca saligna TaxID=75948 RepID=A0AA35Z0U2_LACSI|nr:unnamed protein product [Lactuca saligna]